MERARITIPAGTEVNFGLSEDSDSIVLDAPKEAEVMGEVRYGALPVQLIEDGQPMPPTLYFHQPEVPASGNIFMFERP